MQFFVAFNNSWDPAQGGPPADFDDVLREDQARIRELYAAGTVRNAWSFDRAERGGALLFETGTREQFEAVLASIPLVRRGYNEPEVFPLAPFPGFVA